MAGGEYSETMRREDWNKKLRIRIIRKTTLSPYFNTGFRHKIVT